MHIVNTQQIISINIAMDIVNEDNNRKLKRHINGLLQARISDPSHYRLITIL
jgi:hypothetical protein